MLVIIVCQLISKQLICYIIVIHVVCFIVTSGSRKKDLFHTVHTDLYHVVIVQCAYSQIIILRANFILSICFYFYFLVHYFLLHYLNFSITWVSVSICVSITKCLSAKKHGIQLTLLFPARFFSSQIQTHTHTRLHSNHYIYWRLFNKRGRPSVCYDADIMLLSVDRRGDRPLNSRWHRSFG